MKLGYACLTQGVQNADFKSCIQKNANDEKLMELIAHNLNSLENIIDYNIKNQIRLFRITSDLIPFGSSPVNKLPWYERFEPQFSRIGENLKAGNIRVSMHPGQYTVLNSLDDSVVKRAVEDLSYHARVLDCLGTSDESKIILHIGGIYQDKKLAVKRFENNYQLLDDRIKRRLVIENDDKSYHILDVLQIGTKLNIPVVFDRLHHKVHSCDQNEEDVYWIKECAKTWGHKDGCQKIHYSQQEPMKRPGSHSNTISSEEFIEFYNKIKEIETDIMLEVKDKNLSAVKCINLTSKKMEIKQLELEWSRYKYAILEHSLMDYNELRKLLRNKESYPVQEFYQIIERTLKKESQPGHSINAAQHIWGYFKGKATDQEKNIFLEYVEDFRQGTTDITKIKRFLWKLSEKYQEPYLLNSYYFIFPK